MVCPIDASQSYQGPKECKVLSLPGKSNSVLQAHSGSGLKLKRERMNEKDQTGKGKERRRQVETRRKELAGDIFTVGVEPAPVLQKQSGRV